MEYINFNGCGHIRTKADLMKYALAGYDYDEALKLYEFFLQRVALPDTEPSTAEGLMNQLGVLLSEPRLNTVCK